MRIDQDTFYNLAVLLLHRHEDHTIKIANDFIRMYSTGNQVMMEKDKELISLYINIIKEVISTGLFFTEGKTDADKQKNLEVKALLNKFRTSSVALKHPSVIEGLNDMIDNRISEKTLSIIMRDIRNSLISIRSSEHVKKLNKYLMNFDNSIDSSYKNEQIDLFKSSSSDLSDVITSTHLTATEQSAVETVRMSDEKQVVGAYNSVKSKTVDKVLRVSNVGLTTTLEPMGGFQLGSTVIFSGITSNYKTNILLQNGRWLSQENDWLKFGKNVLIPFISLENASDFSAKTLNDMLFYDLNHEDPDVLNLVKKTDPQLKAKIVKNFLHDRNVDFEFQRRDPSKFSHYTYESIIMNFIKAGYDIPVSILDYAALMSREGISGSTQEQVQKMMNYVCTFSKAIDHTAISGWQLNNKAAEIASAQQNPVIHFSEPHIQLAMDVIREVDMWYFMHLVTVPGTGKKFLTAIKYKDRYNPETPEESKWFAYQLEPVVGVPCEKTESKVIKSWSKLHDIATGEKSGIQQSIFTL